MQEGQSSASIPELSNVPWHQAEGSWVAVNRLALQSQPQRSPKVLANIDALVADVLAPQCLGRGCVDGVANEKS